MHENVNVKKQWLKMRLGPQDKAPMQEFENAPCR